MQKENIVIKNYILSSEVFHFCEEKKNSDDNLSTEIYQCCEHVKQNKAYS